MIVPIEHDQPRIARGRTAALLEVGHRAGGLTAAEDDRVALDTSCESGIDAASPTFENLAITCAFDVEHEGIVARSTRGPGGRGRSFEFRIGADAIGPGRRPRARLSSVRILGEHAPENTIPSAAVISTVRDTTYWEVELPGPVAEVCSTRSSLTTTSTCGVWGKRSSASTDSSA